MAVKDVVEMTEANWRAEGRRRFGPDMMDWKFKCPSCGHVQCGHDYKKVGAPQNVIGFSCVGRWMPKDQTRDAFAPREKKRLPDGPCSYAGGGLFKLNPVLVQTGDGTDPIPMFAFADETGVKDAVC